MACAYSTYGGNFITWTKPAQMAVWYYDIYRLTANVTATINTASIVAKVSFGTNCFLDPVTTNNTYWYRVKAISWSLKSSSYCLTITASPGTFFWHDMNEPSGFPTRTASVISFSTTTMTFSISPAVTSFDYYITGNKYTVNSALTQAIPATTNMTLFYLTSTGLTYTNSVTDADFETILRQKAIAAVIYYNTADSTQIYFGEERHGIQMDGETHHYLHDVIGLAYDDGLALNTITADQDGSQDTHAQFGVDAGKVYDEDIGITASAVVATTGLTMFYRSGTNGHWRTVTNAGFSVYLTAVGTRPVINLYTSGTWTLAQVTNVNYFLVHVFATTKTTNQIIAIMGVNEYTTLAGAREGANTEVNSISIGTLPGPEMRPIASVIFQTSNAYGNTVKSRIRTTDEGDSYVDWRTKPFSRGVAAGDHGSLGGLSDDDHPQYLNMGGRTSTQSICGDVTFAGNINAGGYILFTAINTPAAPTAGIKLYGVLSGTLTKLMYIDSAGTTYALPSTAAGGGGGNSIYIEAESSAAVNNAAADVYLVFDTASFTIAVNGQCATLTALPGGAHTHTGFTAAITMLATLTVDNVNITANLSVGGTLLVVGTTTMGIATISTVNATANVSVGGTLHVCGATTMGVVTLSTLNCTANASVGGTLHVCGVATLAGGATVSNLSVTANASVGGTLHVCGASTLFGGATISNLSVTSNATVIGTLNVCGVATFSNHVVISGKLTVSGAVSMSTTLEVVSTLNVGSSVSVGNSLYVCGSSTLCGDTTIGGFLQPLQYILFTAINTPTAPTTGIKLYGVLSGSLTKLMYIDSSGTTYALPSTATGGGGGYSITIDEGGTAVLTNCADNSVLSFNGTNFNVTVTGQCAVITIETNGHTHTIISNSLTMSGELTLDTMKATGNLCAAGTLTLLGINTGTSGIWLGGDAIHIGAIGSASNANTYISTIRAYASGDEYIMWNTTAKTLGYNNSSVRQKLNVEPFEDEWELILNLNPRQWVDIDDGKHQFGYVAEEVEQVGLKKLMRYDAEGRVKGYKDVRIIIYLVELLKQHNAKILSLEERIKCLEMKT